MHRRLDRVTIVSEVHPQFGGDIANLKTMILQSKMGGADAVKVQLMTSMTMFGDQRKQHTEITFDELHEIKEYCDILGIELFASVFDHQKIDWCETLGFKQYKIASRMLNNQELCERVISIGKPVIVSTGFDPGKFPYDAPNVSYLYCVSNYPTMIEEVSMPNFRNSRYIGYSDHTPGLSASLTAIARGAKYIEKHFTLSTALQSSFEKAHLGSMTYEQLVELRRFSEDVQLIKFDE